MEYYKKGFSPFDMLRSYFVTICHLILKITGNQSKIQQKYTRKQTLRSQFENLKRAYWFNTYPNNAYPHNTISTKFPANIKFSQFDFSTDLFIESGKLITSGASVSTEFDIFGTLEITCLDGLKVGGLISFVTIVCAVLRSCSQKHCIVIFCIMLHHFCTFTDLLADAERASLMQSRC